MESDYEPNDALITASNYLTRLAEWFDLNSSEVSRIRQVSSTGEPSIDIYSHISTGLLANLLGPAILNGDRAMLERCFKFSELLLIQGDQDVKGALQIRTMRRFGGDQWRSALAEFGGPEARRSFAP
jgi:hypothetical protein